MAANRRARAAARRVGGALLCAGLGALALIAPAARAAGALAEGTLAQPAGASIIPERFLRRWDPVTFFFDKPTGPARGGAEHQPERYVALSPAHPGAYTWLDARTLQFRPAEAWPALSRYTFRFQQKSVALVTLMEAPTRSIPADREEGLDAVERISLTFAEPLDAQALRRMVRIGLRPLPGIDDSQTLWLDQKDFTVKTIERTLGRDPATYVLELNRPIPNGQRVIVRLRLSMDDGAGASFKDLSFNTSETFRVTGLGCPGQRLPIAPEGVRYPRDQALDCTDEQRRVQVDFSAPLKPVGVIEARNLLRFTPAVDGLAFQTAGHALLVDGRFKADTLYRVSLAPVVLSDARGRPLQVKAASELFLHFAAKPRYLQWQTGHGIVERYGPQQLPLDGRGFERVDLRVYPVDPLDRSFWPFPDQPLAVDEQTAPPAPGEEPVAHAQAERHIEPEALARHLRTLGSPPVSALVKLPLQQGGPAARFGLDLAPHLAVIAGARQPGTYLVGVRQLDESTQRSWVRVQVTDLSLSTIEEESGVTFAVTSIATGAPVAGAQILVEGARRRDWVTLLEATTGADGTYRWSAPGRGQIHTSVRRIVVRQGSDVLVLDPLHAPDRYADNQWSGAGGTWLQWTQEPLAARVEPAQILCHLFTERPVYRPEDKVYVKGYVRERRRGALTVAGGDGVLVAEGPGGLSWRYPVKLSAQGSFDRVFDEANAPTGPYSFHLERKDAGGHETAPCGGVSVLKEAYRAPEFDLRIAAPEQVALDREFQVQLTAQYYAGGQATERPVRWRVTQYPYAWTPASLPGYYFSSDGRFSGRENFRGSPALEREAKTDANGSASLELNPAAEPTGQPRSYVIEATVTGADDQTVSTTQRVLALPAIVLGLKTPRYIERGKAIAPQFIVVGPDGKPVAGQEVRVRLIKREWHSHLQAGDFSRAEAKYVNEVVDRKISEQAVKSEGAARTVALALEGAGVYVVELEARDRLGRGQTVAVDLYAGGDEPVSWSRPPSEVFKVTPDKSSYEPGETAHLVLESPFQQAQGLAIVEAPEGNRYQWFTVNHGAATFDVPIEKNFVPRLPVHFVLMRGRVPGLVPMAGGRIDLGKPATVAATSWLAVEPVEHQVKVVLENPPKAQPGETIAVKIALSDRKGRPVAGEVTLWLVDQAVLALGKEQRLDPVPDFITPVTSRLGLQDTRNWTLGLLPLDEQPGGDHGAREADQNLLDKVTLRKDFRSVPFYEPAIAVGADGLATVRVKLPDNLTNFKLRAKAASGPDRFGAGSGQVAVRLPLIVQPALPRFVRPGDRFSAAGIGRVVEGEGGTATAQLRATGVDVQGTARRTLELKPNQPQRIEFDVSVPTPAVTAQGEAAPDHVGIALGLERSAVKARDGFDVQLPLRPDRLPLTRRELVDIAPGQGAELAALAEPARPGTLRRTLIASDQPALVRMAAGLDLLREYPYGCTEQRVSRARAFLAMKAFDERLQRSGADQEVKRVVDDVATWLPGVIDGNGLVSYWPGSAGYVSLTAWVAEFLVEARNAGFNVDAALLSRLTQTLQRTLRSDYTHFITGESLTERVMALRALAAAGKLEPAYLAELARRSETLNLESSAEVLRLLARSKDQGATTRAALARKVHDGVVVRLYQGKEIYGGLQESASARNGLILPSEARTVAEVLRATSAGATADGAADPRAAILTEALVTLGQGDGWGSTQADAAAILALADVLKGRPGAGAAQKLTVGFGDRTQVLEVGDASPIAYAASNRPEKVSLHSEAQRTLVVRAETSYLPQALGDRAPAGASGFVVTREALRQRGGAEPAERLALPAPGARLVLGVGDVVEEHVEVVSNLDRHHVAIVVPLAAGVEPLNPRLATAPPEATPSGALTLAPSYAAYLDDQVAFYYDDLPRGSYHFYFRTRATVAGSYTQPQARAELMYDAAVHGESVGARVEVRPRSGK